MKEVSEVYRNIKKRRKELGITQKQLADKCGYTDHTTITKIEKGQVDITFKRLEQIAEALSTTTVNLIIGDDKNEVQQAYNNRIYPRRTTVAKVVPCGYKGRPGRKNPKVAKRSRARTQSV